MTSVVATNQTILVVGGGISGMTAALEAAETGKHVVLVEKNPYLGGRTAQLYRYFPKMCHPTCGLEINLRRLKANPRIQVLTMAEVTGISGTKGDYTVNLKTAPRYVNENCTACGECAKVVTAEIDDAFNYNLGKIKAAYLPHAMAYPQRYVLDASIIGTADADKAKAACKYNAIDLNQKEEAVSLKAGAIVWATGWQPYDAEKITPYRYGEFPNVITNVEFERLADPHGPTGGKILRPSDGKEAKNIAFIQCAGSRDENHLRHCSRFCCMGSLKQTHYVQEKYGDEGKSTIYYIDIRAIDRFEDFYAKVRANPNVSFVKSKVARISEDKDRNPVCWGVNTEGYKRYSTAHDLVVLAVGMEPSVKGVDIPAEVMADSSGFIMADPKNAGIFGAGCATNALDVNRAVQSATAAALRAIQVVNKVARAEA
ncbi:MAG: CoB--CoM heterodisulfide reductase iron-sulfur subunit A family protein [Hydrogenophilaceae bacterium]|nr:CoB--CoM heterodisulfide reductase iron-sulfur subunit A family protein [Hydrogenophilaceae bacterium]